MELPNTSYLDQLCGDDEVFRAKLIAIIKQELPSEINAYNENLQQENFKKAADVVHKLKHKVSILGLEKSYYIAEQFEVDLKQGSTTLQNEFEKTLAAMQDFVSDL